MSANVVYLHRRRPALSRLPSGSVAVSGKITAGDYSVVVTVLDKHGEPVEGRLSLKAARDHVEQVERAIEVGEQWGRRG